MTSKNSKLRVFVFGAGRVGRGITRALRAAGVTVTLRAARTGLPPKIDANLVVLAVRDCDLGATARRIADAGAIDKRAAAVHVAGALDARVLDPLRPACAGVGQMHPLVSFASMTKSPRVAEARVHIHGDAIAVARARRAAKLMGMIPWTNTRLDTVRYHAAAGLVANGAAALAAVGAELLVAAGVPRRSAVRMLGPLLHSVADNVAALGFPDALTGPVRRGDVSTVEHHLRTILAANPDARELYIASARTQLHLARQLEDALPVDLDHIEQVLASYSPLRSKD
jgi:predicted short-subunit dehydrogenase-like oxidoreductase (DUF2520 family)